MEIETVTKPSPEGTAFAHPRADVLYTSTKGLVNVKTRATIAFQTNGDSIEYAVAFCSPKDNFSRTIGRSIAEGRLKKNPIKITPLNLEDPLKSVLGDVTANHLPTYWASANLIFG